MNLTNLFNSKGSLLTQTPQCRNPFTSCGLSGQKYWEKLGAIMACLSVRLLGSEWIYEKRMPISKSY